MSTQFRLTNNRLPQSIDRHEATVVGLLFSRGPTAVAGGVGSIVVWPSVERCSNRALTHIGDKIGVIIPSLARLYAYGSVAMIVFVRWAKTSVTHRGPTFPSPAFVSSVFGVFAANGCVLGAAARLDAACSQVAARNDVFFPTVASAQPACAVSASRHRKNDKLAKSLIDHVDAGGASAGLSVAGPQIGSRDDLCIAAVAAAQPMRRSMPHISKGEDGQTAETLTGDIQSGGHHSIVTNGDGNVQRV